MLASIDQEPLPCLNPFNMNYKHGYSVKKWFLPEVLPWVLLRTAPECLDGSLASSCEEIMLFSGRSTCRPNEQLDPHIFQEDPNYTSNFIGIKRTRGRGHVILMLELLNITVHLNFARLRS